MLWIRNNLFSSYTSGLTTILLGWLAFEAIGPIIDWAIIRAVWPGSGVEDCIETSEAASGACWALIYDYRRLFLVSFYPIDEIWRVLVTFGIILLSMTWLVSKSLPGRNRAAIFLLIVFPILSYLFLDQGLQSKGRSLFEFGGLAGSLYFAYLGFVIALFVGLAMALLRRSEMIVLRWISVVFTTTMSFVPVAVLVFVFYISFNYFLPADLSWELASRFILALGLLFSSCVSRCLASAIEAVPADQISIAQSLGLGYWPMMFRVILPQAVRTAIPGLMDNLTGLIKSTTVLLLIGYFDVLGIGRAIGARMLNQTNFAYDPYLTTLTFGAIAYWAICSGLSAYGRKLRRVTQLPGQINKRDPAPLEHRGYDGASLS